MRREVIMIPRSLAMSTSSTAAYVQHVLDRMPRDEPIVLDLQPADLAPISYATPSGPNRHERRRLAAARRRRR